VDLAEVRAPQVSLNWKYAHSTQHWSEGLGNIIKLYLMYAYYHEDTGWSETLPKIMVEVYICFSSRESLPTSRLHFVFTNQHTFDHEALDSLQQQF
jgi:hypothetical protein